MSSIVQGYEYDIFISYRQKDNKYDGWVTEFVDHLKRELEATFKEDLSIFFDENPHDRLLETYNVDKSLEGKLKEINQCEKANSNFGHFHHVAYNLAEAYALLGDYEKSVNKLSWAAENGFPNYAYFRDDPYLTSLHQFAPYNELLKKLKISNEKFRKIANE